MTTIAMPEIQDMVLDEKCKNLAKKYNVNIMNVDFNDLDNQPISCVDYFLLLDNGDSFQENCKIIQEALTDFNATVFLLAENVPIQLLGAYTTLGATLIVGIEDNFENLMMMIDKFYLVEKTKTEKEETAEMVLSDSEIIADAKQNAVIVDGQKYFLSIMHFKAAEFFIKKRGELITYEDFNVEIYNVFAQEETAKQNTRLYVSKLKRNIPYFKENIMNIRGKGYVLR